MKLSAHDIAVAANYLRPMKTPTKIFIPSAVDTVMATADAISHEFPDAVHVGMGGRVSQGRLADSLLDEFLDPTTPQTIILEIYEPNATGMRELLHAFFSPHLGSIEPHPETVLIIIGEYERFPTPLHSRSITMELAGGSEAALA